MDNAYFLLLEHCLAGDVDSLYFYIKPTIVGLNTNLTAKARICQYILLNVHTQDPVEWSQYDNTWTWYSYGLVDTTYIPEHLKFIAERNNAEIRNSFDYSYHLEDMDNLPYPKLSLYFNQETEKYVFGLWKESDRKACSFEETIVGSEVEFEDLETIIKTMLTSSIFVDNQNVEYFDDRDYFDYAVKSKD